MTTRQAFDDSMASVAAAESLDSAAFAKLLSALPGMAYECSVEAPWTLNYVSDGVVSLCGYESRVFTTGALVWGDVVHPDDLEGIAAEVDAAVAERRQFTLTYRIFSKTGEEKWVLERGEARYGANGKALSLIGFIGDITEQKAIEQRLRDSEEHHRSALELNAQLSWSADPDGNVLELGSRLVEASGLASAGELAKNWANFLHPDDRSPILKKWARCLKTGRPLDVRFRVSLPNGDSRWIRSRAAPKRLGGMIVRWYGTTEDIHDQVLSELQLQEAEERHQKELLQASSSTAMGTMASTLAHELNQPLTAAINFMTGSEKLLRRGPKISEEALEGFSQARAAVRKAGEIIRRVRTMLATGHATTNVEYLAPIVDETVLLMSELAREAGVTCKARIPKLCVQADRIQLEQVIQNLIRNAIEAVAFSALKELKITAKKVKGFAQVSVADTGTGLTPEVRDHLFTPFRSTKDSGLGVGLSLCRTIVEAHDGKIWADQNPRGGTIFRFTIPLAEAA